MFNIGDRVRCINNQFYEGDLVLGQIHTISGVRELNAFGTELVELDGVPNRGYKSTRFELVQAVEDQPQQDYTFYLVVYRSGREILRKTSSTLEEANRFIRILDRENTEILVKKKITVKY